MSKHMPKHAKEFAREIEAAVRKIFEYRAYEVETAKSYKTPDDGYTNTLEIRCTYKRDGKCQIVVNKVA